MVIGATKGGREVAVSSTVATVVGAGCCCCCVTSLITVTEAGSGEIDDGCGGVFLLYRFVSI